MTGRKVVLSFAFVMAAASVRAEIVGRVFSPEGKPLTGTTVTAYAQEGTEARAKRLVTGQERRALATTKTGVDGSFRLEAADPVVVVAVRALGFAPLAAVGLYGEPLTLNLMEAPTRRGTVTAMGQPVSDALVIWTASSPWGAEPVDHVAHTGKDGSYEVPEPEGWATGLIIVHRDFALFTGAPGSGLTGGKSLTHELAPGVALRGRVSDERNAGGIAGATIWIDDWPRGESTADGAFTILHVSPDWRSAQARTDAMVGSARPGSGRLVIAALPVRRLSGIVRDATTKQPLAGARVLVLDRSEGMTTSGNTTTTDARGQFTLSSLAPGRYVAHAMRPGYAPGPDEFDPIDLRRSKTARRDLDLVPLRRWTGRVVDEQEKPVEGALVTFGWDSMGTLYGRPAPFMEEGGDSATTSRTVADGSFVLTTTTGAAESLASGLRRNVLAFKAGYAAGRVKLAPDAPSGPLVITLPRGGPIAGRVSAADGTPLADVAIALAEAGPLVDLRAQAMLGGEGGAAWAKSDREGRFTLRAHPVVHHLLFHKEGFAPRLVDAVDPREVADLDVVLERGSQVGGQVVHHDGRGVAGATVTLSDGFTVGSATRSEADGSFHIADLSPGRYELGVRTDIGLSTNRMVEAPASDLRIELGPTTTVRGRVVDATTRLPVPRFEVALWPSPDSTPTVDIGSRTETFTTTDGTFVLEDVPLGESTMSVRAEGYRPKDVEGLSITGDSDDVEQEVALETGASIRGRVTGPDGRAVPDASVSASGDGGKAAETDENGAYELTGIASGDVEVVASKSGYRTARRTVEARPGTRLDLTLSSGLALRGLVVSGDAPVPHASVSASSRATDADSQTATTDAGGRFTLRGLAPGRYSVTASGPDGASAELDDVDVATAGSLRLVLERTPTTVLTGTVVGIADGRSSLPFMVMVMVRSADGPSARGMADASGAFRVEGAPTGPVTVTGQAIASFGSNRTSESKELILVAGVESTTILEFRDDLTVSGTVTRAGREVPGTHVSFRQEGEGPSARTDVEGRYRVNLAPGPYTVRVIGAGISYEAQYLAQESGTFDIDVTGAVLRGRTLEAGTARPLAGVDVSLWPVGGSDNRPSQELKSNAGGGFEATSVREGRYRIVTALKGFGQQVREIELGRGETADVLLELQAADGVSLKVADARDHRTLEAIVVVRDRARRVVANRHAGAEADGAVTIPLADGSYLLSASSNGYGTVTLPITAPSKVVQVDLTPGGTLVIESTRSLRGRIRLVQPDGDEYVRCWCNGIAEIRLEGSRTRVEHITPGAYSVELVDAPASTSPRPVVIREGQVSTVTID